MGKMWTKKNKDKFSYKINITVDKVKEKQKVEINDEDLQKILQQEVVRIEWIKYHPLKSSFLAFDLLSQFCKLETENSCMMYVTVLMYVQFCIFCKMRLTQRKVTIIWS